MMSSESAERNRDRIDGALDRLATQVAQCSSVDHRQRVLTQVNVIRSALGDLVAESYRLRRKVRYLELTITEEVGSLSPDERAELDHLRDDDLDVV